MKSVRCIIEFAKYRIPRFNPYMFRKCVVHHDLSPKNILVSGCGKVKICDFGSAVLLDEQRKT